MTGTTKISIRLNDKALEQVDGFAKLNEMNRTSTLNLFVKFAVQYLQQTAQINHLDRIENQLKAMQKANYKALVYLSTATTRDPIRFEQAETIATKNVTEIFEKE